jgi:cytochrome P450
MMVTLLQVLFGIFFLFYLYIKYLEHQVKQKVKHSETGKPLPLVGTYLSIFKTFFTNESRVRKDIRDHQIHGPIYSKIQFFRSLISVASPELAKTVLTDSKTFIKPKQFNPGDLNNGIKKLFHSGNVVFVEGEDWKRQRKSINPGFYDLSLYASQIIEKTKSTMEYYKSNPNVKDIHDSLQKMTL